jgi:hypothetical protein
VEVTTQTFDILGVILSNVVLGTAFISGVFSAMVSNSSLDTLITLVYPKINIANSQEKQLLKQAAVSHILDSISQEEQDWVVRNEIGEVTGRYENKLEAIDSEIKRLKEEKEKKIEIIGKKIKVNGDVLPLSEYEILLENLEETDVDY